MPQAVKQATAITHEDAQRIAKEAAAAVAAAEPLKLIQDDRIWRERRGADLRARCRSIPTTATARGPDRRPLHCRVVEARRQDPPLGRTSQRRRLSTSRRSRAA